MRTLTTGAGPRVAMWCGRSSRYPSGICPDHGEAITLTGDEEGYTLERVRRTDPAFRQALAARDQGAVAQSDFNEQYRLRLDALDTARDALRALLALATAWLVAGIIGISLLHRWPWAALPERVAEILRPLGTASTIFTGAFYSSVLCAVFLLTELRLVRITIEICETGRKPTARLNSLSASAIKVLLDPTPLSVDSLLKR